MEGYNSGKFFKGIAGVSVHQQSPFDRALGRMVTIPNTLDPDIPVGDVESDLAADAFWRYYKTENVKRDPVPAQRDLNARLLDWAEGGKSWESSKAKTAGRLLVSSMAAGILQNQLITDPQVRDLIEKQKEQEEAQAEQEQAEEELRQMEKDGNGTDEQRRAAQQQRDQAQAKAQAAASEIAEGMDKLENSQMGQAIRAAAIKQAQEGAEKAVTFLEGWGVDPGTVTPQNLNGVQSLINSYGPALEQITKLMGRIQGIALTQKGKRSQKSNIVVQDGYTQKLPQIFPGELALLGSGVPDMIRAMKMGEYADHGLSGMVEGSDAKQEGGIIFLVDGSGSMHLNDRHTKATALALGMSLAAKKTGQPFKLVRFAGLLDPIFEVTSDQDPSELMTWAGKVQNGGTDFDRPMTLAMDYINTLGDQTDETDVIMITDGTARLDPQVMARFRDFQDLHHTRLIYLAVGAEHEFDAEGLVKLASSRIWLGDGMRVEQIAETLAAFLWDVNGR